jgi:predicted CXXCH cytochrome family protein
MSGWLEEVVTKAAVPSILVIMLALSPVSLLAAIHPVPLDKNTDSAKCIECHEEKGKGKVVHGAVAAGCTSCHEIRVNKDVTRVKLKTTTSQALCISCHADMNASDLKGKVHPPAVRDCVKCHNPHTSDNKFLLIKAESGEKDQNLCLTCHTQGLNVPKDGSKHAALEMGCETCHVTHKVGDQTKIEFQYHLTKATPALCLDCHDATSADLVKAHQGQPFGKANCVQCHDPHQSRSPKLMQAQTHPPFAGGQCDTCHKPAKDGKVVLTETDIKVVCVGCHSEQAEKIEKSQFQHPGAQGDCTACHNPHAGKTPGFLQPDPVSACLTCHSEQADQMKKAHLHQPAFAQGCATCHEPHGSQNVHLLRAANPNPLCLECHGPDAKPKKLESEHMVAIFNGQVKLPENYFAQVPIIPIKYGMGHPIARHPVVDQMDPTNPEKVKKELNCATCHQPHSSAQPNLLVKDQATNAAFCDTCHKTVGTAQ